MRDAQVRLKSNGKYWQAWWSDTVGGRKVKSLGPKSRLTKRDAQRACAELMVEMVRTPGRRDITASPTLAEWCDRHLVLRQPDLAASTMFIHRRTCGLLVDHFGDVRMDSIGRPAAEDWRHRLLDTLGPATVAKHVRCAKAVFSHAMQEDLLAVNVFDRLKSSAPHVEHDDLPVTEEMMSDIIAHAGACNLWIAMAWYAGLRRTEAFLIEWRDVQWDANRLVVRSPGGRVDSKHRRREVRIEPALMSLLLDEHDRDGRHPKYVVGARSARNVIVKNIQSAAERLGHDPEGLTLQRLRRERDTIWHQSYPAYVCSAWLGHTEQVAMRHYLSVPDSCYDSSRDPGVTADKRLDAAIDEIRRLKTKLTTYQESNQSNATQ